MAAAAPPARPGRRRWLALALLPAALAALPFALDTDAGRVFVASQLPRLVLQNGLSFRVGRIDGSLWGRAALRDVVVLDQDGRFASADQLVLDWRPLALLEGRFEAAELSSPAIRLARLPRLKPTADKRILPQQDIRIDRLAIGRLTLAKGVAGPERALTADGRIDLHAGRALVRLDAHALALPGAAAAGDRLLIDLDAEPDRDRLALDARLDAPAGGIVTSLAGLSAPLSAHASGHGRWLAWDGRAEATLGGAPLARLSLSGRDGAVRVAGRLDPAPVLAGTLKTALAGGLAIDAQASPDGDFARLAITASGSQLAGRFTGRLHRADERLVGGDLSVRLADGGPLARGWGVAGTSLTARLTGPLLAPLAEARLSLKRLRLGDGELALSGVSLAAIADLGERPLSAPVAASATGLAGLPATLAPLAGAWRGEGRLGWRAGELSGSNLSLRSGPLVTKLGLTWRPASGAWGATLAGSLRGWALPGVGASDADFRASLKPGIAGSGDFRLVAARPPEGGLTRLTGGGLTLAGQFSLQPGLVVALSNLVLGSPRLDARGTAGWRQGSFTLAAAGQSRDWGPFQLEGNGSSDSPHFAVRLPRPGYGVSAVAARLDPAGAGWRLTGDGQTGLGPVALAAGITVSPLFALDIERLTLAGFTARGRLAQTDAGPLAGTLALDGPGLDGSAALSAAGGVQQADVKLAASNARFDGATPLTLDKLLVAARVRLPASGPMVDASLDLAGAERGNLVVERATGTLKLVDGKGNATLSISGNSGAPFKLAFTADVAPGRWQLAGGGDYDDRAASFAAPAVLTRDDSGWHLAPVTITSALGNAELSGDWGDTRRLAARLERVSLQLVGLAYPSVNLNGRVSGAIDLSLPAVGAPSGRANLRLNGLSRSAVAATSSPIDVGLNAALGGDGLVMRAVIVRAGAVEGRAQARLGPIPDGDGDLVSRIAAASVTGQLRYAGPIQDLWGLSGFTALDARGTMALAADVAGTLGNPQVDGRIRGSGGRVEAPLLGAVATDATLEARFTQSRLELVTFAGKSGLGSISGSGSIDLSLDRGFPMDIRMAVKDAAILGRDDVSATGSGNIRVATDEYGGVVSGTLTLSKGDYRVGRTAVADVPVLAVTERNTRLLGRRVVQYVPPTRWLFNLNLKGDRRLMVTGMGINSEWQADVRLRGAATAPELFGRVQLVRGDYDFSGKRFQLTRGDIRFVGGYPPDPIINVTAENSDNGFTAQLSIEGTAQKPQIKFASVPALPEDEVLSRVLFGSRVTDLSAPEAIQLAGALASLRGRNGFNPIGAVGRGLGIDRLRILPADATTGRKTTFAAGQYVGRNVYVELATDAGGYNATSIEIGLTRSLSVLSQVATLGGTSAAVRWKKDY